MQAEPDSITVLMPKGVAHEQIATEPVHLDSVRQTASIGRSLMVLDGMRLSDQDATAITVTVTVRPAMTRGSGP